MVGTGERDDVWRGADRKARSTPRVCSGRRKTALKIRSCAFGIIREPTVGVRRDEGKFDGGQPCAVSRSRQPRLRADDDACRRAQSEVEPGAVPGDAGPIANEMTRAAPTRTARRPRVPRSAGRQRLARGPGLRESSGGRVRRGPTAERVAQPMRKSETLSGISDLADLGRFSALVVPLRVAGAHGSGPPEYSTNRGAACLVDAPADRGTAQARNR
jgi:hypothetical protein